MISYDTYQNKIKRLAAVKNFIVRFRALFITLLTAIIALTVTLILIKGIITQDVVLPDKIIYGDTYSTEIQSPKALFSNARYQFKRVKEENSLKSSVKLSLAEETEAEEYEWSYDVPTLAGKYLVRTVSQKSFGVNYGEPKEFEIETCPVEFRIESDTIVYGEMPEKYTFELKNGDRLITDGVKFVYPESDVNDICANAKSFVILNKDGEDVTFCYDISVTVNPEEVTILPKDITLSPEPLTVEYDGTAVDYNVELTGESLDGLAGDSLLYTTKIYDGAGNEVQGTPVNAGTYTVEIVPDGTAVFNGGTDVTGYYNITYSTATLEITKRSVTVTTPTFAKEYDGTLSVSDGVNADGVIAEHTFTALYTGDIAINAGEYENKYECTFFDSDGADVTANYEISYVYGTLEIYRRAVTVTTADRSKIYDGTPLSESNFTKSYLVEKYDGVALVDGHYSELIYSNEISLVAQSDTPNTILIEIYGADGNSVTDNYEIEYVYGNLEIKLREISVTSVDAVFIYNGEEQCAAEIESIEWTDGILQVDPLVYGEQIYVISGSGVTYYSGETVANVIECVINNGAEDTTANYKINYINGTLKIEKRQLIITTATLSWDYDGEYHYGDEVQQTENGNAVFDGLVDGEFAEAVNIAQILNNKENKENNNTTEYKFYTDSNKETETTDCYEIEYINGTLSINKIPLLITTATLFWVYDGEYHYGDEVQETENGKAVFDGLVDGEFADPFNVAKVMNFSEEAVENTTEYKFYSDSSKDKETTDNYIVTYFAGSLTVGKRFIVVQTASAEKEYDGTPLSCPAGWVIEVTGFTSYNLVDGHNLEVDESKPYSSIINVGAVTNKVNFKIVGAEGDVSENYGILYYENGELKITPRNIQITTASGSWIYDGDEHFAEGYDEEKVFHISDGKADGEVALVSETHKLTLVEGSATVVIDYTPEKVKNKVRYTVTGEEGVAENYNVTYIEGELEIIKRPIIVITGTFEKIYDGLSLDYTYTTLEVVGETELEAGLVKQHRLNVIDFSSVTDVKWAGNSVSFTANNVVCEIVDEYGNNAVNSNYEISYEYGTLTVTPRPINITTGNAERFYDGKPLSRYEDSWSVDGVNLEWGLVAGHDLSAKTYTSITDVQRKDNEVVGVENIVEYEIYDGDRNVTGNYKISYEYGTLTVTPRPIIINTASDSKVYDGKPLSRYEDGWSVDGVNLEWGLVAGHDLSAKTYTSITDVQRKDNEVVGVENIVEYDVYDGDRNVTGNYKISYEYGTLTVTPRPIIINTASDSKVYDGTPLSRYKDGWSVDGVNLEWGLVTGHDLSAKTYTSITDVQRKDNEVVGVENIVEYEIYDGDRNVTGNYEISYEYGTLTVTPRPIKIITDSAEQTYNGTALTCDTFEYEALNSENQRGLLSDQKIAELEESKSNAPSITYITADNCSKDENGNTIGIEANIRRYQILDGTKDVTGNYEIDYSEYGYLVIKQQDLIITTATLSWDYDGEYHYGNEEQETENGKAVFAGLVDGEVAEAVIIARIRDYTEDTTPNDTRYMFYFDGSRAIETTLCYNIDYICGTLAIIRVKLQITTLTASKVYDGTPLNGDDEENYGKISIAGKIVAGETYKAYPETVTSITDFTESTENLTRYGIYDGDGNETSRNYEIGYTDGELSISKRVIEIKTQSKELEYNGVNQSWTQFDYAGDLTEVVNGHRIVPLTYSELCDVLYGDDGVTVTGIQNTVTYQIVDGEGSDISYNYDLQVIGYGTLTVTPREILITTANGSWEYDGKSHSAPAVERVEHLASGSAEGALTGTHILKLVSSAPAVTEVKDGTVPNELKFIVVKSETDSSDVSGNYNISYDFGTLVITERKVTIILTVENSVYGDYEYLSDGTYVYAEGSNETVDGETLVITVRYQQNGKDAVPVNAGEYVVVLDTANIVGGDLANYDISVENGGTPFSITKRPVTVILKEQAGKSYDGEIYNFPTDGFELADGSLVYGDAIAIAVKYSLNGVNALPLNSGEYTVMLDGENCKVNGEENLNYTINCLNTLTYIISKINISFDLNDLNAVYSGVEYVFDFTEAIDKTNNLVGGDVLAGATFVTALDGEVTKAKLVNDYSYTVASFKIVHGDGTLSDNYVLDEGQTFANLSIEKRSVEVSVWFNNNSNSSSCEYSGAEIALEELYGGYPVKSNLLNSDEYGIYSGDLEGVKFEFTYLNEQGEAVPLQDYGKYEVCVSLTGDVLENNYSINYNSGYFAITERQIAVYAQSYKVNFEYNGEKLDKSLLYYTTKHVFSDEEGFNPATDADNYVAEYYLYKSADTSFANDLIDEILQAGEYVLKVELTPKQTPEKYEISYVNLAISVSTRKIYVQVADYTEEYTYNGNAVADSENYITYYADGNWVENSAFVNNDADGIESVVYYYCNSTSNINSYSAKDAGEYTVKISGFNTKTGYIDISSNYTVLDLATAGNGAPACGKLTIKPATVVIVPTPYTVPYDGTNLTVTLPESYYEIVYVEGKENDLTLFEGATLSVKSEDSLDIRNAYTIRVSISEIVFGGTLATNYNAVYTYDASNELIASLGLKSSSFLAKLTFERIEITVKQIEAPEKFKSVQVGAFIDYDEFLSELGSYTLEVISGGLLSGHSISISGVSISNSKPKVVEKWLRTCTVIDENGNNVSNGYKVTVDTSDEATYIQVVEKEITVYVYCSSLSDFENGVTAYEAEAGALIYGETLEVNAVDGELVATMLRSTKDYSSYYKVQYVYLGTENNLKEAENASWI